MITANNLSKIFYDGAKEVRAVDGVSFTVPAGKLFTLLGPAAAARRRRSGALPAWKFPTGGEIAIGNKVVFAENLRLAVPPNKRNIGMVFQIYAIWPHMTVFETSPIR